MSSRIRRRVAFLGLFGVGNIGNEASLRSAHEGLRSLLPDTSFECICTNPEAVRTAHHLRAMSIRFAGPFEGLSRLPRWARVFVRPLLELGRWWTALRVVRGLDAVIVPGTGILDDFGVRPWQMPYDLFRWSSACLVMRTRFVLLSIGAGPIENRANRWLMVQAFRRAKLVSFRDRASRDYMLSLGCDVSRADVQPDLAFTLERSAPRCTSRHPGPKGVGIGVMSYYGWTGSGGSAEALHRRYVSTMARVAQRLSEREIPVRLIVGDRWDEHTAEQILDAVESACGNRSTVKFEMAESLAEVQAQMESCEVVVGARYHNLIGALMLAKPVVAIAYSGKHRDLLARFGLTEFVHDIAGIDPEAVLRDIDDLTERSDALSLDLQRRNAELQKSLHRQYRRLAAALG